MTILLTIIGTLYVLWTFRALRHIAKGMEAIAQDVAHIMGDMHRK